MVVKTSTTFTDTEVNNWAIFPHRFLFIMHTLLCFKKTIAIMIDVLCSFFLEGFAKSLYRL